VPDERERVVRIRADRDGPLLVEGPVEVIGPDGDSVVNRRFVVAICTCRRSRTYPWCDTSHRRRAKNADGRDPACAKTADDGRDPNRAKTADDGQDPGCGIHPDDGQDPERKETRP
jgi:CDGSH-type Zn-finger protein